MELIWVDLTKAFVLPILLFLFSRWYISKQERKNRKKAVLCSLFSEVKSLRELIQNRLDSASKLTDEEKPFAYITIKQNYFSVYESSVKDLSVLDSDELIKEVIHTYMETKGLFDDVKGLADSCQDIRSHFIREDLTSEKQKILFYSQIQIFNNVMNVRSLLILSLLDNLMMLLSKERKE